VSEEVCVFIKFSKYIYFDSQFSMPNNYKNYNKITTKREKFYYYNFKVNK